MSKGINLRMEEYVPVGAFLKTSFVRDRVELVTRFSEFSTEYLNNFEAQLNKVDRLEQTLSLTEEQKNVTSSMYNASDALNKELNFLSFYFERAGLDSAIISAIKRNLSARNIEGAILKMNALIQYVGNKKELLEAKGMSVVFPEELVVAKENVKSKNELQNEVMNIKKQLHRDNKMEYDALYSFISVIAKAGKIMYTDLPKKEEYTITKITTRTRRRKNDGENNVNKESN